MGPSFLIFLVLLGAIETHGGEKTEHVHFKIYVPEIIKHHIHTKTIFIHVHHPPKKKKEHPKKHEHLQSHHDDWSSWSTFNHHSGYGVDQSDHTHDGLLTHPRTLMNPYSSEPPIPFYDDYRGGPGITEDTPNPTAPVNMNLNQAVTGYHHPPQYETHEEVDDIPQNDLSSYEKVEQEQDHREGHEVKTGHLYTDELKQFYDDKVEESAESFAGGSDEENVGFYGHDDQLPKMLYS